MSDTIDAAAQPAIKLPRVPNLHPAANHATQMPARDLVRLAQGFYFVFWGLLMTVLTGSQLIMLIGVYSLTESFLAAGVVAILVGSWRLFQVRSLGERWHRRARLVFVMAALLDYLCVCFCLWRRVPENTYLLGNALAFVAVGILYVIAFNRAMAELAISMGRPDMAFESRVLGAANVVLLLLPLMCVIAYLIGMVAIRHTTPIVELQLLLDRVNLLVILVLLLPFSLTLSLAWGCKDAVLRYLATFDRKPLQDPDLT